MLFPALVWTLVTALGLPPAQTPAPQFANCHWWAHPYPPEAQAALSRLDKKSVDAMNGVMKLALARGILIGVDASILNHVSVTLFPQQIAARPDVIALLKAADAGHSRLESEVGLLTQALDTQCADYRNTNVGVSSLAMVIMLQLGGLPSARTDAALDVLRRPDHTPPDVLSALLGSSSPAAPRRYP